MHPNLRPLAECQLYTFVDTAYLRGRDPARLAAELCAGGADLVQLRAKGLTLPEVRRLAELILPVTNRAGVWFVLNDHAALAAELGAPCCHLGQEDFFDAGGRHTDVLRTTIPVGGRRLAIGLSSHAPAQAERAVAAGADYVAVGPVYATGTKPGRPPVTLEYVRWAAAHLAVPWFAIGGVNSHTLSDVVRAGATRVCIVSAILEASDVAERCREFRRGLPTTPRN